MALQELAPIALRPRWAPLIAPAAAALLAAGGCHHNRQSLRPVYAAPAAVSAPCTNCGSASSAVVSPAPAGSTSRPLSSEPTIDEPAPSGTTESTVPSLGSPAGSARSSQREALPEPAPKATIGSEPDLDMLPAQSVKPRAPRSPTSSSSPSSSTTGGRPPLQGPGSASSSSRGTRDGIRTASANGRVGQAVARERLRTLLGESGSDELFYPNKADRPWKYVVLHHSASPSGNYDQIDAEHRKVLGYDGCGYHFVIGNGTGSEDGQIEVAQRWVNQKHGVHCRNAKNSEIDEYGIGICFVGDLDKEPPTDRQVAAARALVAYLRSRYAIDPARVETHAHLAATPTVCPGKFFPTATFAAASTSDTGPAPGRPVPTSWQVARGGGDEALR
jgi:hypothetical protein